MVVHVLPLDAFSANTVIDIAKLKGHMTNLRPMGAEGWTPRINLDGIVNFATPYKGSSSAYLQVFRSGVVESVSALWIDKDRMHLPSLTYEQYSINSLEQYLTFAEEFEIHPPYYVFLSFIGVRGCEFGVEKSHLMSHTPVLEEDMLILPEVIVQNRDEQPHKLLRTAFDMVWNSFGFISSRNYDDSGNWKSS